eukprot:scaffold7953_cov220-Pinguiococcus_pyrenoidosus.AAC.5
MAWESLGGIFYLVTAGLRRRIASSLATPAAFALVAPGALLAYVAPVVVQGCVEAPVFGLLVRDLLSGSFDRRSLLWILLAFSCGYVVGAFVEILYIAVDTRGSSGGALSRVCDFVNNSMKLQYVSGGTRPGLLGVAALTAVGVGVYLDYRI